MSEYYDIYKSIAERTGGDIYIGVVGPVRTGKSTFIKKFMECLVLPNIEEPFVKTRAQDELSQSSAGRTIMTTEPKFIPEEAVRIELKDDINLRVRMIDCVGYIVNSALGYIENEHPRMIVSPWFDKPVPFELAAETGTRKVIAEHSTIGIVITTDGSISDIPRADYVDAERRVITELKELNKPFVVLLNCVEPFSDENAALSSALSDEYGVPVMPINCLDVDEKQISDIMSAVASEFPVKEINVKMPQWLTGLAKDHWLKTSVFDTIISFATGIEKMRDVAGKMAVLKGCEYISCAIKNLADLGTGSVQITVTLLPDLFYKILGELTGIEIADESSLLPRMLELVEIKKRFSKIEGALAEVEATGYGIVMPSIDELKLEEPVIMKQGGRFGVKLCA